MNNLAQVLSQIQTDHFRAVRALRTHQMELRSRKFSQLETDEQHEASEYRNAILKKIQEQFPN